MDQPRPVAEPEHDPLRKSEIFREETANLGLAVQIHSGPVRAFTLCLLRRRLAMSCRRVGSEP